MHDKLSKSYEQTLEMSLECILKKHNVLVCKFEGKWGKTAPRNEMNKRVLLLQS